MSNYIKENYVKDKVIVITGASSGFGAATARKAAAMGGKVVLAARRTERLAAIVDEIKAAGGDATYITTDVRAREQVFAMVQHAIDTYGRIDVLVNDAGNMPHAYFADYKLALDQWEECLDNCIKGTLFGMCAAYDPMIAQGRGQIINISSTLGNYAVQGAGVYNVAKVGVRFLADSLRVEAQGKIKVTTVRPTSVPTTELNDSIVSLNASMGGLYGKLFAAMGPKPEDPSVLADRDNILLRAPTADDLADNIIYVINQPWGVNISDITVRASGENMYI